VLERSRTTKDKRKRHATVSLEFSLQAASQVLFVSTVLSKSPRHQLDSSLGAGREQKRFNVAISRAKALLVIVGNPFVALHDPNWSEALHYCVGRGAYAGCECEALAQAAVADDETFVESMAKMAVLGGGYENVSLEDAYRDDMEFRVVL